MHASAEAAVSDTRRWLERAVIGLNLCPFAKAVHMKGQIYYAVSAALNPDEVLAQVGTELDALATSDPATRETTLLIVTGCLQDFLEFTDLVTRAERLLRRCGHEGAIQLASFHPAYRFAQTEVDDISNFTNRAPYPTIHLLRETSIDRAVRAFPQAQEIYEANIHTLQALGFDGWSALDVERSK